MSESLDIGQHLDGGISDFQISGQSFINKNSLNFRISHEIDMKIGPITKPDKKNTKTSKEN